jgi:hypothetical protein
MKMITVRAEVTADHMLRLELPCDLTPGKVDVMLAIQPVRPLPLHEHMEWRQVFGLGRELWQGVDAASDLRDARAGRERAV